MSAIIWIVRLSFIDFYCPISKQATDGPEWNVRIRCADVIYGLLLVLVIKTEWIIHITDAVSSQSTPTHRGKHNGWHRSCRAFSFLSGFWWLSVACKYLVWFQRFSFATKRRARKKRQDWLQAMWISLSCYDNWSRDVQLTPNRQPITIHLSVNNSQPE